MYRKVVYNLKLIYNQRTQNGWVLAELFVVFIVMWFLCDSLGCLFYTYRQPVGYDLEHVYRFSLVSSGERKDTLRSQGEKTLYILQRLRERKELFEAVGIATASSEIMGGTRRYANYFAGDTANIHMRRLSVDEGYMNVFRLREKEGSASFASMPSLRQPAAMITQEAYHLFKEVYPEFSLDVPITISYHREYEIPLHGILSDIREYRFDRKVAWIWHRLDDEQILRAADRNEIHSVLVRVWPQADGPGFREYLLNELAPRLDTDDIMINEVVPYSDIRKIYEEQSGEPGRIRSQGFLALFLLVNIFLGVVSTFWYRTRRCRGEIALHIAMGSSRPTVRQLLFAEGLLLLAVVALPAILVCLNLGLVQPMIGNEPLVSVWPVPWSIPRFVCGILVTWLLMAVMVVLGIWFPARQVMRLQPAEVLHEE